MNIVYITKYPPHSSGFANKIFWESNYLADRGHTISVFTTAQTRTSEQCSNMLERDNLSVHEVNMQLKMTRGFSGAEVIASAVAEFFNEKSSKPDLIIGCYLFPYGFAAYIVSQILNVPFAIRMSGSDSQHLGLHQSFRTVSKLILENCCAILTPSHQAKYFISKTYGLNLEKVIICGITPGIIGMREIINRTRTIPESCNKTCKQIYYFGKLVEGKGLKQLVKAFSKMSVKCELHFVGDGKLKEKLLDLSRELNIVDDVHFHGHKPIWEIPLIMSKADLVIAPQSGFSIKYHACNVIYEAMSMNVPILASSEITNAHKIIVDNVNGFIFDPNDDENYSKRIDAILLTDKSLIVKNATNFIDVKVNEKMMVLLIESAYHMLTTRGIK